MSRQSNDRRAEPRAAAGRGAAQLNPANDIRMLIDHYMKGDLELDELVTRTYTPEEINQGYTDMLEGRNIRGLVVYD